MNKKTYENAMAEVNHYLKGIRQEDLDKIPKKLLEFIKDNASKDYNCVFDYTKPLKELDLLIETRGIIGMICYNYWCETTEQKQKYLTQLNKNEKNYLDMINKNYTSLDSFIKKENPFNKKDMIINQEESRLKRILLKIINFFKRKKE